MIDFACKEFKLYEVIKCSLNLTKAELSVMRFMLEHDKQMCTEGIAKELKLNLSTVQRAVKKLHEKGVIVRGQENLDGGGYIFTYKRESMQQIKKIISSIVHKWVSKVDEHLDKI